MYPEIYHQIVNLYLETFTKTQLMKERVAQLHIRKTVPRPSPQNCLIQYKLKFLFYPVFIHPYSAFHFHVKFDLNCE